MNIFVCATAARTSGALVILKQFVDLLPRFINKNNYFIFISDTVRLQTFDNVTYIPISTSKWFDRIKWDNKGFKEWINLNNIKPDLILSFQNTGLNYKECPQLIYYHQLIPLIKHNWNPFNKRELIFFLYRYFYPYFIRKYIYTSTQFVVQTPYIKGLFAEKFGIEQKKIHVIKPDIETIDFESLKEFSFNDDFVHFVYPSTPLVYKNHIYIIRILIELKRRNFEYLTRIKVHFTFNPEDDKTLYKLIKSHSLNQNIVYEGVIPHVDLLALYGASDALLFPSYIETLGLPLLEASAFGLPIVVSDLPYARDVIGNYEGAHFAKLHDINIWADLVQNLCMNQTKVVPLVSTYKSNWDDFFSIMDEMIKNNKHV